ncbi:hypothetical protein X975_15451, partial [Stegodyphus mimosarum]
PRKTFIESLLQRDKSQLKLLKQLLRILVPILLVSVIQFLLICSKQIQILLWNLHLDPN